MVPGMRRRRGRMAKAAARLGCDSLAAFGPENLFYMTGFWGDAIGLLDAGGHATIIAPELEAGRARAESVDAEVVVPGRGTAMAAHLARMARGTKPCTDCQDYTLMRSLKRSIPGITHSAAPFGEARMIKDPGEIATLRKASRMIDGMFELCTREIREGQKESELQAALMCHAMERGMFDTGYPSTLNPLIIAGGPNGALPHAQVTGRRFRAGDLITVDITLRYMGYVSDSTRTFALGRASAQKKEAYEIVKESQRLGLRAARPRATARSVDDACRNHIDENNYGKYFIHSTGHGIGLDVHEPPAISRNDTRLLKNMAITVEPGIYIPGKFGIRIEDSLIIRDRPAVMHRFTKELLVL